MARQIRVARVNAYGTLVPNMDGSLGRTDPYILSSGDLNYIKNILDIHNGVINRPENIPLAYKKIYETLSLSQREVAFSMISLPFIGSSRRLK